MRKPTLIDTLPVPLADIQIEARLRPVNMTAVTSLMHSIETVGLKDEIHLRRVRLKKKGKDGKAYVLRLMAGGHRIEAFRQLGLDDIPAKIWDCTDDYAKLIEIDDNLAHNNLEPLDLAVFLAERKRVYEEMFPETKWGAKGLISMGSAQTDKMSVWKDAKGKMSIASFVTSTAQQMGQSDRNVFRMVSAAMALDGDTIESLRKAPKRVSHSDLQTIAKIGGPDERAYVCNALVEGKAKNAAEAFRMCRAKGSTAEASKAQADQAATKLAALFQRCSKDEKRRFVRDNRDELEALLAQVGEAEGEESVVSFSHRAGGDQ